MKLYDLVRQLLIKDATLRDSDKKLMWEVWKHQGCILRTIVFTENNMAIESYSDNIKYNKFLTEAETPESITRCRRKVQEDHPELQASTAVKNARKNKQVNQGKYFVYHERVNVNANSK